MRQYKSTFLCLLRSSHGCACSRPSRCIPADYRYDLMLTYLRAANHIGRRDCFCKGSHLAFLIRHCVNAVWKRHYAIIIILLLVRPTFTCVFLQMFFAALLITLKRPLSSGQIITDNDRGVKNIAICSVAECHFVNE